MKHTIDKNSRRLRIHVRIRRAVKGSSERPRLAIFRSLKHIYAQIIDDRKGQTVVSASSNETDSTIIGGNLAGAKAIGQLVAERAIAAGVKKVVFDRGGFLYHGRIKALAEAAREAGLEF
jgi:large subunit ribosomal protein L18